MKIVVINLLVIREKSCLDADLETDGLKHSDVRRNWHCACAGMISLLIMLQNPNAMPEGEPYGQLNSEMECHTLRVHTGT